MGRHYSAVAVRPALDDLHRRIVPGNATLIPSDEAPSGGRTGVVEVGRWSREEEWSVVWGEVMFGWHSEHLFKNALERIAEEVSALIAWTVEDTSGSLWFTVWLDGERARDWLEEEGELTVDEGTPLPFEPLGDGESGGSDDLGEWDMVIPLVEEFIGPWEAVSAMEVRVYDLIVRRDEVAKEADEVPSKPWWKLWRL